MTQILTQLIAHLRCQLYLIFTSRPVFYVLEQDTGQPQLKAEVLYVHSTDNEVSGFIHISCKGRTENRNRPEKITYILSNGCQELALETKKKLKRGMAVYPNEIVNARLIKRSFQPNTLYNHSTQPRSLFDLDACDIRVSD